jgi:hypothetical protein
MADAVSERECMREKELWRRFAFLAAEVVNISGKSLPRGKHVKAKDFIRFDDDDKERKGMTPKEIETRKRQAMETAKLHKSKFWTKIKDESVRKVTEG